MRLLRHIAILALALTAACDARAENTVVTPTALPVAKVAVPNVFAYDAPAGWAKINIPPAPYPAVVEGGDAAGEGGVRAMITINTDASRSPLTDWCSKSLERNQSQFASLHAQVGSLHHFATSAGVPGCTATVDLSARSRSIHYVMYFFAGAGDTKIAVTCACAAPLAARYAPIFDAAMKTFVPY